jgi:hypothetical protein
MKPGTPAQLCNRATFPLKCLRSVKLVIACRAPWPAWAADSFALHPDFHKKRTQGPSAEWG